MLISDAAIFALFSVKEGILPPASRLPEAAVALWYPARREMAGKKRVGIPPLSAVVGVTLAAVFFVLPVHAAKPVEKIEYEPAWDPDTPLPPPEKIPWDKESAKKYGKPDKPEPGAIRPPGAPYLDGITWVVEAKGYTIRLTQLDAEMRWRYIQAKTGAATDPFANTDPDSPGFLVFALELESSTVGDIVLEAQRCRLISSMHDYLQPLDIPTIEAAYGIQDGNMPPAYRQVKAALIDGEVILHDGDSGAGLLVYKGIDPKADYFKVEVALTTPVGEVEEYELPYRRIKSSKRKKKNKS
jgi:hypothetical protein